MGNSLTPCSTAKGYENIYCSTPYFKIIKKKTNDVDDIDKLFDYHNISNCQKLKTYKIHSNYE